MKLVSYILIVLMIGFMFTLVATMVTDMQTYYPDYTIDTSEWNSTYDYSSDINNSMAGLQEKLKILGDEDKGWFPKLAAGITVIPLAVIEIPSILISTLIYGNNIISGVLHGLVPEFVITFIILALLVTILFAAASYLKGGSGV